MKTGFWLAATLAAGLSLFVSACSPPQPMGEDIWRVVPQRDNR